MKRKAGKSGTPRKRSKFINDEQKKNSIFDDDIIPMVDTKLLKNLPLSYLYEDPYKKSDDTDFIPFSNLPPEMKEDLRSSLKRWHNVFKEKHIHFEDEEASVLRVGDSHKHDVIPVQRFKKYFKDPVADPSPSVYLNPRQSSHLYQLDRYDSWETFITPLLFSKSRGKMNLRMTLQDFITTLENELGFDVFSYGFNKDRLLHVFISLDSSDVFFVCCIFTLIEIGTKLTGNFDQIIDKTYSVNGNPKFYKKNHIAQMKIELQKYYYFTCGCEK